MFLRNNCLILLMFLGIELDSFLFSPDFGFRDKCQLYVIRQKFLRLLGDKQIRLVGFAEALDTACRVYGVTDDGVFKPVCSSDISGKHLTGTQTYSETDLRLCLVECAVHP